VQIPLQLLQWYERGHVHGRWADLRITISLPVNATYAALAQDKPNGNWLTSHPQCFLYKNNNNNNQDQKSNLPWAFV
jgi:hypothetical protein